MVKRVFSQALRTDVELMRGHPDIKSMSKLRRRVAQLISNRQAKVGRTSGYDGLQERYNSEYSQEYQVIVPLYRTTSVRLASRVEASLIDFFWEHLDNENRGSAGPAGKCKNHYVYLVYTDEPFLRRGSKQ